MNSTVWALAMRGSTLYAGGHFSVAGGVPANSIAAWDGNTWAALGSGVNPPVLALAVSGTDLNVGGQFTSAGGKPSRGFAIWHGGAPSTPTPTPTTPIACEVTVSSTDVPKNIPDYSISGPGTVTSTLTVNGIGTISDIELVGLNISHTWLSDLRIALTSPDNTTVLLIFRVCSSYANFTDINLDDSAAQPIDAACPPAPGRTFRPGGSGVPPNALSLFNGENASGTWTLTIRDLEAPDAGILNGWGLNIRIMST